MKTILLVIAVMLIAATRAVASLIEQTDVFIAGQGGYHSYRIPAVIRAADGTLLAFCEGRKTSVSDTGDIDLLLKRSTDGGRTWSAAEVIWDDAGNTCGNPCPVLDEATGTIWLLLTHNLGIDRQRNIEERTAGGTRTVWVTSSSDHGASWGKPVDITATTKAPDWTWYATGPGIGIQLRSGPFRGRLVIPCDHGYDLPGGEAGRGRGSHAIYSDDHGATWKIGGTIRPDVNECQVVELFDDQGTLLMDMRSYQGRSVRAQSTSTDGGVTWAPMRDAEQLVEPVCQASIIRHDTGKILFSNPAHPKQRVRMTVRESTDNGVVWRERLVLHAGPAAYSSLVSIDRTTAGCLYERGEKFRYEKITFARFPTTP